MVARIVLILDCRLLRVDVLGYLLWNAGIAKLVSATA
jgi:hypothetical protein